MFILQVLGAVLILSFLVFIHELGHFLAARKNGVKVHEFAIGFGKNLFTRKKGDTEYKINLFPLGGYVRLHGEDSFDPKIVKDKDSFASKTPWQKIEILTAGVLMNFLVFWVLATGALMFGAEPFVLDFEDLENNFEEGIVQYENGFSSGDSEVYDMYENADEGLLSMVESGDLEPFVDLPAWRIDEVDGFWSDYLVEGDLLLSVNNIPVFDVSKFIEELVSAETSVLGVWRESEYVEFDVDYSYNYEISKVFEGSIAEEAGVEVGDVLISVDGVDVNRSKPVNVLAKEKVGEVVEYEFVRDGEVVVIDMSPEEGGLVGMALLQVYQDPLLGFGFVDTFFPRTIVGFEYNLPWWKTPWVALQNGWEISKLTAQGFVGALVDIVFNFSVSEEVGGPVQVAKLSYEFVGLGGTELMNFIALISLSLAVINVLPIPALDGGRILFVIIEALRAKPLDRKMEAYIHAIGFIALMAFIVVVTIFDLLRL